jgi:hypothetical protein
VRPPAKAGAHALAGLGKLVSFTPDDAQAGAAGAALNAIAEAHAFLSLFVPAALPPDDARLLLNGFHSMALALMADRLAAAALGGLTECFDSNVSAGLFNAFMGIQRIALAAQEVQRGQDLLYVREKLSGATADVEIARHFMGEACK